jgi:hypothetical protein
MNYSPHQLDWTSIRSTESDFYDKIHLIEFLPKGHSNTTPSPSSELYQTASHEHKESEGSKSSLSTDRILTPLLVWVNQTSFVVPFSATNSWIVWQRF